MQNEVFILDSNIWISYVITKRLDKLVTLILNAKRETQNALYFKSQTRKNFVFLQNIILLIMKKIIYVIYKEGKYYVSQCLNVDVSSFGATIDEASFNLKEALQLYFEGDKSHWEYLSISEALIGETQLNLK